MRSAFVLTISRRHFVDFYPTDFENLWV